MCVPIENNSSIGALELKPRPLELKPCPLELKPGPLIRYIRFVGFWWSWAPFFGVSHVQHCRAHKLTPTVWRRLLNIYEGEGSSVYTRSISHSNVYKEAGSSIICNSSKKATTLPHENHWSSSFTHATHGSSVGQQIVYSRFPFSFSQTSCPNGSTQQ